MWNVVVNIYLCECVFVRTCLCLCIIKCIRQTTGGFYLYKCCMSYTLSFISSWNGSVCIAQNTVQIKYTRIVYATGSRVHDDAIALLILFSSCKQFHSMCIQILCYDMNLMCVCVFLYLSISVMAYVCVRALKCKQMLFFSI